jgi:hypothetical protein
VTELGSHDRIRTFAASFGGTALRGPRHLPSTPLSFLHFQKRLALAQFLPFLIAPQNLASASHNTQHSQHSIQVCFHSRPSTPFFDAFLAFFEVLRPRLLWIGGLGAQKVPEISRNLSFQSDTKCMRCQSKE